MLYSAAERGEHCIQITRRSVCHKIRVMYTEAKPEATPFLTNPVMYTGEKFAAKQGDIRDSYLWLGNLYCSLFPKSKHESLISL